MDNSRILPILRGNYSDPSVLRVGADFYLTHSCNAYAPAFTIWHSTDLLHWTPLRPALHQFDGDIWAPDLILHEGTFFLYYTTVGGNHVLSAPSIEGPWSAPVDLHLPHIDPGHLVGADGTRYLYLSNGHVTELAPDGLSARGEMRKVHDGWSFPASWRTEGHCLESPKPLFRDGWYYLISAQGGTAGPPTSHMITVARARDPLGPWQESPHNPLLRTQNRHEKWWSRGHGTLFDDASGNWWILYHAYENGYYALGRLNLLEPVAWTSDGWPVIDTERDLGAVEPQKLGYTPVSDDFGAPQLGWQWQFYQAFEPERFQVGGGELRLQGRGESAKNSSPLALLAQYHAYTVEVDVEIEGDADAGLLLFYDERCFVGLGLTRDALVMPRPDRNCFMLDSNGRRRVRLRLFNDDQEVELWFRFEGEQWQQLPYAFEVSGWHHNALGHYNSLRVALYCAGTGAATFRNFVLQGDNQ